MLARQLRPDTIVGRLRVIEVKTPDTDGFIPFNRIGVLFFDMLNRRYVRAMFSPRAEVDHNDLPGW